MKKFTLSFLLSAIIGRLSSVSIRNSAFRCSDVRLFIIPFTLRQAQCIAFYLLPFTFFLFSFSFASAQVNLDSGLVAYYPFNGNANDESGNGNNGTVNGAALTIDISSLFY
jgi:hypothetical protein